jgi:hypothetical protein
MKLVYTDAKTNEVICQINVHKNEHGMYEVSEQEIDELIIKIQSNVYKTYGFMIDCALYCMNDGDMFSGSYDNDEDEALAHWVLLDDFVECAEVDGGFVCQWFDNDLITHDEFYKTYSEVKAACESYIKAGLFGSYIS